MERPKTIEVQGSTDGPITSTPLEEAPAQDTSDWWDWGRGLVMEESIENGFAEVKDSLLRKFINNFVISIQ